MIFNSDIENIIRDVTKLFPIHHLSTNIYVKIWKKVLNKTREIVIIVLVLAFQPPRKGHTLWWCNGSWHLPGNPKLVRHPAYLIKEEGCV